MYFSKKIFLFLLCLINFDFAQGQVFKRTATTSFNTDNGLLQNSVTSIVVDKYGFVWFSSAAGIQRYDGSRFETIHPFEIDSIVDKSANLDLISNEEIWISHVNGITVYDPVTHRFKNIYKQPASATTHLNKYIGEDDVSVWYLNYTNGFLRFDKKTGKLLNQFSFPASTNIESYLIFSKQINKKHVVICGNNSVSIWDLVSKKLQNVYESSQFIQGFLPLNDSILLIIKESTYFKFNLNTKEEVKIKKAEEAGLDAYFQLELLDNGNILAGYKKNIYELDPKTLNIKTKWAGFNQEYLINSGYITNLYLDRNEQLWVITNSDGVKRINFNKQSFEYFGTSRREDNFVRCIYPDAKKGIILAGTYGSGLLIFDTAGYLINHIPVLSEDITSVIDIQPLSEKEYLLVTFGKNRFNVFDIKTKTTKPLYTIDNKKVPFGSSYYGKLHRLDNETFVFTDHYARKFKIQNNKMVDSSILLPYSNSIYNYINTNNGEHCFSTSHGLVFFDKNFNLKKSVNFNPLIKVRCMAQDSRNNIWLGTETGLYKANENGKFLNKYTTGNDLPDDGIYAIQPTENGIFFSHNKGLSFLNTAGNFTHYTRQSGLQENEFNTKSTYKADDGKLYFGGINGITSFYPKNLSALHVTPNIYITALQVMGKPWKDTAVWNISEMNLPYNNNMVALRIGVPGLAGHAGYNYEYKLEGLEPNWITTSGVDFIRYVLPPGEYIFKARIISLNDSTLKETQLKIFVASPWWQLWWVKVLAILSLTAFTVYIIHSYNQKKYLNKIKQLELEQRIQVERQRISRDLHDNLGAYASAIANNVDHVVQNAEDQSRFISLRENASEIMTNLRDTIWALNKNDVSITRLCDRMKTYFQKMQDAYPNIKIEMKEDVDAAISFSPEYALNLLRIVQEAIHNAIKHSKGNKIYIIIKVAKEIYISIQDNGIGLKNISNNNGSGLENMKIRAKENKMELKINFSKERGTSIELFSELQ